MSISIPISQNKLGVKLVLICALTLLMAIPAMFISYISYERAGRADDVTHEVSARYGGEQVAMGPILAAPYSVRNTDGEVIETGDYVVFAETGEAVFPDLTTTIRKRSLFKVPTYQGAGQVTARFAALDTLVPRQSARVIDWGSAQIYMSVSDVRGLKSDIKITRAGGERLTFEPAVPLVHMPIAVKTDSDTARRASVSLLSYLPGRLLSVPAKDILSDDRASDVTVSFELGGAQSLSVLPFAQTTSAQISADWPDPGFAGAFPPVSRTVSETGFSAQWSVPRLARNMPGAGAAHELPLSSLSSQAMQVSFVDTASAYKTVNRSLKYAVLFIGMVFLAYFLFEVMVGVSVHPAQYILIGLAQSIFYLLLLAFSEHVGFTAAFIIAALATIGASAGYAGAVFGGREYIVQVGGVFTLVYALLYALMQIADFALMIGALAAFIAIAGTMYLTRNVDWYGNKALPIQQG